MEQLGLEGMPRRLFACTPSRLLTWLDCPLRYRFTYVDRPPPPRGPAWAHNSVGAAVHLALARWWDLAASRRTADEARRLVDGAWSPEGFADAAHAERWRARAGDMVAAYVDGLDPATEVRGVERTVACTTEALAVSGRVDRVDQRGDELVVVDYKTGRSVPTEDDARGSLALALYVLGTRRTFRRPSSVVELHHLPSGTVARWRHTPESLARHVSRAETLGEEIVRADAFPARPSALCGWCDFLRVCPVGQAAAGRPRKPWDGLAEEREPVAEDEGRAAGERPNQSRQGARPSTCTGHGERQVVSWRCCIARPSWSTVWVSV